MRTVRRFWPRLVVAAIAIGSVCSSAFAWDGTGHRLSVLIALEFRPDLKPRLEKAISHLKDSKLWKELRNGGFGQNARMNELSDPDKWVATLDEDLPRIATWADWIRGFKEAGKYGSHHYINLSYETDGHDEFKRDPNAVTQIDAYVKNFKSLDAAEQAWELAWLSHLIGDLHQPLHCVARKLPDGSSDLGGNKVQYNGKNLHAFWDDLLDKGAAVDIEAYAKRLYSERYISLSKAEKSAFEQERAILDPMKWAQEGQAAIRKIGYPADKLVSDYDKAAVEIAETRIVLSGARMADLFDKLLPK